MDKKFIIFIKYYFPALFLMGVIFFFSNIANLKYTSVVPVEIILRKGAHFTEFFILGILTWYFFYVGYNFSWKKTFIFSFGLTALYAVSDEIHQLFIPGRSGELIDVIFDWISIFISMEFMKVWVKRKMTKKTLAWIITAFLILAFIVYLMISQQTKTGLFKENILPSPQNSVSQNSTVQNSVLKKINSSSSSQALSHAPLPKSFFISVPFTSQAPFGQWDQRHEEACEEASLIMLHHYFTKTKLTPQIAQNEIQSMINFEIKTAGAYADTNAAQTAKLYTSFFGPLPENKKIKVIYDFGKDDIKKYLVQGNPIIVPTAGQMLKNPYFTFPGPLYHNLVLVGYNGNMIISNDAGTKRGKGYKYDINTLFNAIHDFPGSKKNIKTGRKAMIVVVK